MRRFVLGCGAVLISVSTVACSGSTATHDSTLPSAESPESTLKSALSTTQPRPLNAADGQPGSTTDDVAALVRAAFAERLPDTEGRFVAAAVVVDVDDGRVVASERSDGEAQSLIDRQRPSGSTFKLFVDVALAEAGVLPDDGVLSGRSCRFPDGVVAPVDETLAILSIREATATSSNCAFGKLARALGPERLRSTADALGITRPLELGTRFGFGGNTTSVRELAEATAAIVRGGDSSSRLRPQTSDVVAVMTADVVVNGTAAGWALDRHWAISKTGTTARSTNAWFVGATREYAMSVWLGNPNDPDDGMIAGAVPGFDEVHGGDIPAAIWHDVMDELHRTSEPEPLRPVVPDRPVVIVADPTMDCVGQSDLVQNGPPGPEVPWLDTGGQITC